MATHPDTTQEILQNQEVFVKDFDAFPNSTIVLMLENSLIFAIGEDAKHQRGTMSPAFHFDYLKSMIPMFVQKSSERLESFPAGEVFNAGPLLLQFTVDVLGLASFGMDFKSITQGETHEYLSAYNTLLRSAATEFVGFIPYSIKRWLPLGSVQCNKAGKTIINMTHAVMEARKGVTEKKCSIDMMLAADPSFRTEDVQTKAREEVDRVLQGKHPNADNVKELPYLEKVIKEVMRFGSPVALAPTRVATKDFQIDNVFVPKGTKVGFDIHTIHNHPEFWPTPEIFNPDRFSTDANQHPYAYLAFSYGKRNCIGLNFSLIEQRVFLSMVLQKFLVSTSGSLEGCGKTFTFMLQKL